MNSSVLTLKLGNKIFPGTVTTGNFDGKSICFTAATQGDRILLLQLNKLNVSNFGKLVDVSPEEITFLNINQPISCLCAGPMVKDSERSFLFVGTLATIFAYDVENNKDLFFKEVIDGVNVITTGILGGIPTKTPIAIAGGNCSLQGFDSDGNDCFWTVTGDNCGAVALFDYDGDGENELIVGSDDYDLRVFKGDQIVGEATETDSITCIFPLQGTSFAYALANGTIGVYDKLTRLWRIKSKNHAVSICGYDFDGDGIPELVTGWSNGKMDIRNTTNGEVLFKDNFTHPLAGICTADLYMDGKMHLLCCDVEGEVRIYKPGSNDGKMPFITPNVEQDVVRELSVKKHNLLLELKNYETGTTTQRATSDGTSIKKGESSALSIFSVDKKKSAESGSGAIPVKTELTVDFAINLSSEQPHIEMTLSTNNDILIRAVLIFAEGIFQGECHVVHPKPEHVSSKIYVPLFPPKNVVVDLHIKAYVGSKETNSFHVFELTRQLPKFSMFALCKEEIKGENLIMSFVKLPIQERPTRVVTWLNQNFLLGTELEFKSGFELTFLSLRNSQEFQMNVDETGETTIRTTDIDLAGDLLQSLCKFLSIYELETEAEFTEEIIQLDLLIRAIEDYQESNDRLGAEIADQSGIIKSLLIRAEDARLIGDTKGMRKWYTQLHEINRILMAQHQIRCTTNENVIDSIKAVNQIIQKAARLRVGKAKANVINSCREAVKSRDVEALGRIIRHGAATSYNETNIIY